MYVQFLLFLLFCQITQKSSKTGQILANAPNLKKLLLGELVILHSGFTEPSIF